MHSRLALFRGHLSLLGALWLISSDEITRVRVGDKSVEDHVGHLHSHVNNVDPVSRGLKNKVVLHLSLS